ncbi:hypothetical protein EUGRSUZ_A01546 [Eucalyptus grandis]|uniref:Uncharacterized protein n=2 Tax=Eucalyptus grandis TaxID=71139 RepID=A0A059DG72_EUCGR|nr:hypothetical protein EUGRSUZ_A01546 [Eucalyptus grandis]
MNYFNLNRKRRKIGYVPFYYLIFNLFVIFRISFDTLSAISFDQDIGMSKIVNIYIMPKKRYLSYILLSFTLFFCQKKFPFIIKIMHENIYG